MSLPPPPADDGPVASPGPPRRESLPRGAATLFFAIRPAGPQAEAIARAGAALADEWGLQGRAVQAARLHVTLHFLGGFDAPPPSPLVDAARGAAAGIVSAPFEIVFDRVATFGRGSALAMCGGEGLADVTAFRRHLGEAKIEEGRPDAARAALSLPTPTGRAILTRAIWFDGGKAPGTAPAGMGPGDGWAPGMGTSLIAATFFPEPGFA